MSTPDTSVATRALRKLNPMQQMQTLRKPMWRRLAAFGVSAFVATSVVAIGASGAGAASGGPSVTLSAAGSTFDQPFFTLAFYNYHKQNPSVTVNYASIGSGGGQQQFESNIVNFGASDVPMFATEIAKATGGTVLQLPIDMGGEAVSYNLYGVHGGLHMTGPVLAKIYLGQITKWNDPTLTRLNPGVALPTEPITVVHRSDGSGTTYAFTTYLSKVSPAWKSKVGATKSVAWPVGVGGQGNEGVAGVIADTPGSIGYVELDYALVNHFTYCKMLNPEGRWVLPTLKTSADEAALHPNVSATDFSITDLKPPHTEAGKTLGKTAYPISTYSWVLVYKHQKTAKTALAMLKLLDWATHAGQKYAKKLDYVPLPPAVQATAQSVLEQVEGPTGKPLLSPSLAAKYAKTA